MEKFKYVSKSDSKASAFASVLFLADEESQIVIDALIAQSDTGTDVQVWRTPSSETNSALLSRTLSAAVSAGGVNLTLSSTANLGADIKVAIRSKVSNLVQETADVQSVNHVAKTVVLKAGLTNSYIAGDYVQVLSPEFSIPLTSNKISVTGDCICSGERNSQLLLGVYGTNSTKIAAAGYYNDINV